MPWRRNADRLVYLIEHTPYAARHDSTEITSTVVQGLRCSFRRVALEDIFSRRWDKIARRLLDYLPNGQAIKTHAEINRYNVISFLRAFSALAKHRPTAVLPNDITLIRQVQQSVHPDIQTAAERTLKDCREAGLIKDGEDTVPPPFKAAGVRTVVSEIYLLVRSFPRTSAG